MAEVLQLLHKLPKSATFLTQGEGYSVLSKQKTAEKLVTCALLLCAGTNPYASITLSSKPAVINCELKRRGTEWSVAKQKTIRSVGCPKLSKPSSLFLWSHSFQQEEVVVEPVMEEPVMEKM